MSARDNVSPVLLGQAAAPPHLLSPQTTGTLPSVWTEPNNRETTAQEPDVREEVVTDRETSTMDDDTGLVTAEPPPLPLPETQILQTDEDPQTAVTSTLPDTTLQAAQEGAAEPIATTETEDQTDAALPAQGGSEAADTGTPTPASDPAPADSQGQDPDAAATTSEQDQNPEPSSESNPRDPEDDIPAWVKFEHDTSVPDEEEMKEITSSEDDKLYASDVHAMEEQFFTDVGDPEQRPVKKLRLTWLIKGVRGTRENPNFARVMHSPGALSDGFYWSVKFYPRGDNCASLSAFVRCSKEPPPVDEEGPESQFAFFEGGPDTDFSSDIQPKMVLETPRRDRKKPNKDDVQEEKSVNNDSKKPTEDVVSEQPSDTPETSTQDNHSNDTTKNETEQAASAPWRVSAQLGVVIYNPAEPRTKHLQSDGHQFWKNCDDWGWINFVSSWDDIHRRKRGQRQALLRDDTLAIDAYIRIYDDPTESLWWHESKNESQWPSKELAGYFSMGTPGLYHSPAVAGITAWMLLAPFREVIQTADGGQWRANSSIEPKPLICQSQLVLDQMRNLSSDCYVNLYRVIEEFLEAAERFDDVKSFWEVFRRGLELEFADNKGALDKLASMFDAGGSRFAMPIIPVPGSTDIQSGLGKCFDGKGFNGSLPDFLPVMLNRQQFDTKTREWKLHHDRIRMNDKLDLSKWCTDEHSSYTLYGFVAHVGVRNSGKFYSVLRPDGIGTKWLAFEDGNGNKVFSYSKKRIQEYEGLEGDELQKLTNSQTRENAYLAMYIRTSCFRDYLTGGLEPYRVPKWLKPWADDPRDDDAEDQGEQKASTSTAEGATERDENHTKTEVYFDECANGCTDMLNLHDIRMSSAATQMCRTLRVGKDKSFKDLRKAIAKAFEIEDYHKIQLWEISYQGLGKYSRALLEPIHYRRKVTDGAGSVQILRLWLSVKQPVEQQTSYKHLLDRLDQLDLSQKPIEEQHGEAETIVDSAPVATTDEGPATHVQAVPVEEGNDTANMNPEQRSILADLVRDVENIVAGDGIADGQVGAEEVDAPQDPAQSTENTDTGDATETPLPSENVGVAQPNTEPTAVNDQAASDESTQQVVHGHLVDAAQHPPATTEPLITQDAAIVPHGDADALAQVLAEEVAAEEVQGTDNQATQETVPPVQQNDSRNAPSTHVPRAYGILQWFDVDQQRFVAQRYFHPELESEIGKAVRKSMGFSDDKEFRIWKRLSAAGTESVQGNITFVNAGLQDVFTLIVGDALSEEKVDELKNAGKFWQPQQLIRYMLMSQRQHPWVTLSSTEPIELTDFGNDYYRGPLIRGRPHGAQGYLITSTGHTYEGPFIAGQKSGPKGTMTYQNGDTYVGSWLNDERHGQGEFNEKRTGNRYVGGFENGKRWGVGTTYWQVADQQADMCQICYEEDIDALFYDCGHVCACFNCAKQCDTCPICRRNVRQVVKMYRA